MFKRVLQQREETEALRTIALMRRATVVDLGADLALSAAKLGREHRLLLAVVVVENRGAVRGRRRIAHLVAAVVIGQVIGYVVFLGVVRLFDAHNPAFAWVHSSGEAIELVRRLSAGMLFDLTLSLVGVAFWYFLRRDLEAREALRQAQVSREAAQRASAEANLAMMQVARRRLAP